MRRRKKRIPKEGGTPESEHNLFIHFPVDPTCQVCLAANIQKATRQGAATCQGRCGALQPAKAFGDRPTADHAIINEENNSAEEENLVACMHHSRLLHELAPSLRLHTQEHSRDNEQISEVSWPRRQSQPCVHRSLERVPMLARRKIFQLRHLHAVHTRYELNSRKGQCVK